MPLRRGTLRKGGNTVHVTVLEGSWILFDRVALEGPSSVRPTQSEGLFVRDVAAAPYESDHDGKRVQPLLVNVEWLGATPTLSVEIDGRELFNRRVEAGRSRFEVPMPAAPGRAATGCCATDAKWPPDVSNGLPDPSKPWPTTSIRASVRPTRDG